VVLAVFAGVFFGVFLVFLVCGGWWFLGCLVDMVCWCRRDGLVPECGFHDVITFLFVVRFLSGLDKYL